MSVSFTPPVGRSSRLDQVLGDLLAQAPEFQAAAVVSFDGLPMASALPYGMDEDRVAAMSAALLSLGERASQGLGRGELSQVYIEGSDGTVFLVSADEEAVLVAVAGKGAKVGLTMYEVRRAAILVAEALRSDDAEREAVAASQVVATPAPVQPVVETPAEPVEAPAPVQPVAEAIVEQAVDPVEVVDAELVADDEFFEAPVETAPAHAYAGEPFYASDVNSAAIDEAVQDVLSGSTAVIVPTQQEDEPTEATPVADERGGIVPAAGGWAPYSATGWS